MNSRVVGIIKFESPRTDGCGKDLGVNFSAGSEGLSLESWLAALVGENASGHDAAIRWEFRRNSALTTRRVRANLEQLAEDLDREYLALGQ